MTQCNKCGGMMVQKMGKNGSFMACNNYPACTNTANVSFENSMTAQPVPAPTPAKQEYHLTIEQVRSNALSCAIELVKIGKTTSQELKPMAKEFEQYFLTGE